MRPLIDMDTIQIEITNYCQHRCSNCTRLIGHHQYQYMMEMQQVEAAIDSMTLYPKMTGIMGGEPLLHPEFEEICKYLHARIQPERCGLWTCLPKGYEKYREVICETFGNIFLNDHTRADILHAPILVCPDELPLEQWQIDYYQHHCWVQNSWSACINPRGAWFCEIAGAIAMLGGDMGVRAYNIKSSGWKVKEAWWSRSPKDFVDQMFYCQFCAAAIPLRKRESTDGRDDISLWWKDKLAELKSPKLSGGMCVDAVLSLYQDVRPTATYKDENYREAIANRYGMFLTVNSMHFQTPHLKRKWCGPAKE